jgi:hypothetical protein
MTTNKMKKYNDILKGGDLRSIGKYVKEKNTTIGNIEMRNLPSMKFK